MPEENLTEVLDTNLKGVFLFMQQELRQFLKQGKSKAISNMPFSIVNVASTAGTNVEYAPLT
jgi:NAD(P)-dependent dehydrogenase (short-subunit alcohol dehydrogenase family)